MIKLKFLLLDPAGHCFSLALVAPSCHFDPAHPLLTEDRYSLDGE